MSKKMKLKGSSFWDRNKPINRKRKMKAAALSIDNFSKRRLINRVGKTKGIIKRENVRPYSNSVRASSNNRYLPDIIEKRYLFMIVVIIFVFLMIGGRLFQF